MPKQFFIKTVLGITESRSLIEELTYSFFAISSYREPNIQTRALLIFPIKNAYSPAAMMLYSLVTGQSILRSFIAPLIVLGICLIWQLIFKNSSFVLGSDIICSIIICFASPASVVVNTYCVQYENEAILSSDVILLSTIISIISVPLFVIFVNLIF